MQKVELTIIIGEKAFKEFVQYYKITTEKVFRVKKKIDAIVIYTVCL